MSTIEEVVNAHIREGQVYRSALIRALQEREDAMADNIRLAGVQFGAYPELTAKVLMDIGLGTPPSPEAQEHINTQFAGRLEWLQQQFGNQ